MKIIADTHIPFVEEYFGRYGELILKPGRAMTRDDVKDADILLVRSITRVNENLLHDTAVKFVGSMTAGADHLDTHWLDEVGIAWSVVKGFNAPPVADYVLSVVAALQTKGILAKAGVRVAIIGVGHVGKLVAERLRLLNFNLVLCDPLRAAHENEFVSQMLDTIRDVDLVTLHVPLTRTGKCPTYHFIGKDFLQRQKKDCVLLNASRGAVIHSEALLQFGQHLHWCLDVFEHEPKIDQRILAQALIASPHIAGHSVQSKIRGVEMIYHIACEKGVIAPEPLSPFTMPIQTLCFAEAKYFWQDIVLEVFNPCTMTEKMQHLLTAKDYALLFDQMRNHFNYRHELAYTNVTGAQLSDADNGLLTKLGMNIT